MTRVVGVSDNMLPQFWSEPHAKVLDVTRGRAPKAASAGDCLDFPAAPPPHLAPFPAGGCGPRSCWWLPVSSQDKHTAEVPPGGLLTRVDGTPVRTLPLFWFAPLA